MFFWQRTDANVKPKYIEQVILEQPLCNHIPDTHLPSFLYSSLKGNYDVCKIPQTLPKPPYVRTQCIDNKDEADMPGLAGICNAVRQAEQEHLTLPLHDNKEKEREENKTKSKSKLPKTWKHLDRVIDVAAVSAEGIVKYH
jgi:hypothetical protein